MEFFLFHAEGCPARDVLWFLQAKGVELIKQWGGDETGGAEAFLGAGREAGIDQNGFGSAAAGFADDIRPDFGLYKDEGSWVDQTHRASCYGEEVERIVDRFEPCGFA